MIWNPERFKACRKEVKLTQLQIATVCTNKQGESLTGSAVSQWEKDGIPELRNVVAAVESMRKRGSNCTIDYITGLSDQKGISKEESKILAQWRSLPHAARDQISGLMDTLSNTPDYIYQQTNQHDQARFNGVAEKNQARYRLMAQAEEKAKKGIKAVEELIGVRLPQNEHDELYEEIKNEYYNELLQGNKLPEDTELFDNVINFMRVSGGKHG